MAFFTCTHVLTDLLTFSYSPENNGSSKSMVLDIKNLTKWEEIQTQTRSYES